MLEYISIEQKIEHCTDYNKKKNIIFSHPVASFVKHVSLKFKTFFWLRKNGRNRLNAWFSLGSNWTFTIIPFLDQTKVSPKM